MHKHPPKQMTTSNASMAINADLPDNFPPRLMLLVVYSFCPVSSRNLYPGTDVVYAIIRETKCDVQVQTPDTSRIYTAWINIETYGHRSEATERIILAHIEG
jgi:hypothetical protein